MVARISLLVKSAILCLTIACLGLHYKSMVERDQDTSLLVAGTFVGFTIIQVATILAQVLGTPINKRVEILYALIGTIMFLASGALIIQNYNNIKIYVTEADKLSLTKGILAVVNGALFLVSAFFSFQE